MSVIAFAEQSGGSLRQVALETVTAARRLADSIGGDVTAVLLGPASIKDQAGQLAAFGADTVLLGTADELGEYAPKAYVKLLTQAIEEGRPRAVLFSASAQGKDLAPRVAARLKVGLASDVVEISAEDDRIVVVRPIFAGKVLQRLAFKASPALISVRPRAYMAEESPREVKVQEIAVDLGPEAWRGRGERAADEKKGRPDVAEAEIIVSGGRGMQGPENWHLLEDLADALGPGTALGASRAVVDAGWRPHAEQVGQTGKVVSPPLYFAVGISGAIQHLAGMRTAKCIVAVNKDAEAPIFKVADYGVVGDLFEIVPRMTEEIRKIRSED